MSEGESKPDGGPESEPTSDERTWATLTHLSFLTNFALGGFSWIIPLVVWQLKKDDSAFLSDQAKEALNFQLTVCIVMLATALVSPCTLFLTLPITIAALIFGIVYCVIAAMETNKGVAYRYPYTMRIIG